MMRSFAIFGCLCAVVSVAAAENSTKPNVLFILADQWRAQATGYAGDPNLQGKTPNLDRLASQSVNFVNAVSGMPVCTPYRASLLTGQYAQTHGLFLNDLTLPDEALTIAEVMQEQGYATGFIGKWHLDGHGRRAYISEERRQGFEYWKVLECTHAYNESYFYQEDDPKVQRWDEYDAFAQARDAQDYIQARAKNEEPFVLFLSWGPPHNPYESAPQQYQDLFDADDIQLRPNVQGAGKRNLKNIRSDLAGYYAHIAALDDSLGELLATLDEAGISDDTIVVFTSDHGDMIGSQGEQRKQRPWDESIRIPFLIRYPQAHSNMGREVPTLLNSPDIMPTLLGLANIDAPESVEGRNFAPLIRGGETPADSSALIACIAPFGEFVRANGGKEYRGVRTERYTYVRDLDGPWLLYDNESDPYQQNNLMGIETHADLEASLDAELARLLANRNDSFLHGDEYIKQWGYTVDASGTVPYSNELSPGGQN